MQEESQSQSTSVDIEAIKQQAAKEVGALYLGALGEKDRQLQELKQLVEQSRVTKPVVEEIDGAKFLENPNLHVRNVISQELATQLAPMQALFQQFNAQSQAAQLKNQLAQNPYYKNILETYGDVVDQLVGTNVNAQTLQNAVLMVPGLVETGQVPNRSKTNGKSTIIPGTIPPSSPPAPKKTVTPEISITESERLIARRMGVSEEKYVELRDADSSIDSWKRK